MNSCLLGCQVLVTASGGKSTIGLTYRKRPSDGRSR
jgi:hypothetical protein